MQEKLKIGLAQINPIVGDFNHNKNLLLDALSQAAGENVDLLITSELVLWGYPARDLMLRNDAYLNMRALKQLSEEMPENIGILLGVTEKIPGNAYPYLYNSACMIRDKKIEICARKQLLPNYDVFDERRYFKNGKTSPVSFKTNGKEWKLGVIIRRHVE